MKGWLPYFFLAPMVPTELLISGKLFSQYASYSLIFSPSQSIISEGQHKKHLYNQASHYRKYRMFNHLGAPPIINSGYIAWSWCITTHYFLLLSLWTLWVASQAMNSVRSVPASSLLSQVSHRSHDVSTTNCHLSGSHLF